MKKFFFIFVIIIFCVKTFAQVAPVTDTIKTDTVRSKNFKRGKLILHYYTQPGLLSDSLSQRLIDAFFKVYPKEIKRFNKAAITEVTFIIDTSYKGVAETSGFIVRFNPQWFHKHPEDIDVVTHEVMHVVQNYGNNPVPGWLTEGIADYARYKFGINNANAGWSLPPFKPTQNYTNAYRITARFLVWAEKNRNPKIVDKLDKSMRSGTYTPELWKKLTGKSVDELWLEYSSNPVI